MGICFEHGLVVKDLSWRPTKSRAEAIHSVLVRWGLAPADCKPELFRIEGEAFSKIPQKELRSAAVLPDEFVMEYPMVVDPKVRVVMGPYQAENMEHYGGPGFWDMRLVLGRDFKICEGADYGPINAKVLPGTAATYWNRKNCRAGRALPATWRSKPPRTHVHLADPMTGVRSTKLPAHLKGFSGLWRSGLWIDFDKVFACFSAEGFGRNDPADGYGGLGRIPNRAFVGELEEAFDTELFEAGWYY